MKRRWILAGLAALFGLLAFGWMSRSGSLVEQIERQGIHMTSQENVTKFASSTFYFVRDSDVPRLKAWLSSQGFRPEMAGNPYNELFVRDRSLFNRFRLRHEAALLSVGMLRGSDRHKLELFVDKQ